MHPDAPQSFMLSCLSLLDLLRANPLYSVSGLVGAPLKGHVER
jgi:hypothetical protein